MQNKAFDLSKYSFTQGEKILIDANIWLYLFPAPTSSNIPYINRYSNAFKQLVDAKAEPVIDSMILSEYLNRYCRIEYDANFNKIYSKYKDFRNSTDFYAIATSAQIFASKILNYCKLHSTSPYQLNINQALVNFATGKIDFNDAVYIDICKKENLKFMTNDADFVFGGIDVLTNHPKLLNTCPSI